MFPVVLVAVLLVSCCAQVPEHLVNAAKSYRYALEYTSGHPGNINDDKGRYQLAVLQRLGLTKESRVLEIGCGALDLAALIVPYLNEDSYVCV